MLNHRHVINVETILQKQLDLKSLWTLKSDVNMTDNKRVFLLSYLILCPYFPFHLAVLKLFLSKKIRRWLNSASKVSFNDSNVIRDRFNEEKQDNFYMLFVLRREIVIMRAT